MVAFQPCSDAAIIACTPPAASAAEGDALDVQPRLGLLMPHAAQLMDSEDAMLGLAPLILGGGCQVDSQLYQAGLCRRRAGGCTGHC